MLDSAPRRRVLGAGVVAICVAGVAAFYLVDTPTAPASHGQATMFDSPRELLYSGDARRQGTLDQLRKLGVDQIRAIVYWRSIARHPNAHTRPSGNLYPDDRIGPYDCLVRDARALGMGIHFTVSGPIPKWASKSGESTINDPKPWLYRDLLRKLGERYGGSHLGAPCQPAGLPRVISWGLYNEPNVEYFLGPQFKNGKPYSPRLYRRLYRAGRAGLVDSGHGGDRILFGELGPRGTSRAMSPLRFLKLALCLNRNWELQAGCNKLPAKGMAQHPYAFRQAPWERGDPGDFTFGSLGRLIAALNRAGRAGAIPRGLPVFITEYGIQSRPDPYSGVVVQQQAEWLAISEFLAYRNPRVRSYAQYLMRDDPPFHTGSIKYGGFESGLRFSDGDKKPAYEGFRTALVVKRRGSDRVRLWGHVRPFDPVGAPPGSTEARIRIRDGGGDSRFLKAPDLNDGGYFSTSAPFRSGREWRVLWTSPAGATFAGPWTRAYRFG